MRTKNKIAPFFLLFIGILIISSCNENKRFVFCDKKENFCLHTNDSNRKELKLKKIRTIFLNNKYNFLNNNTEYVCFQYAIEHIEIYNSKSKNKYFILLRPYQEEIDTSSFVIKDYLNKLSIDFSNKKILNQNDTLILRWLRLPSSYPKKYNPPPLPPNMLFPIEKKYDLYYISHNYNMK